MLMKSRPSFRLGIPMSRLHLIPPVAPVLTATKPYSRSRILSPHGRFNRFGNDSRAKPSGTQRARIRQLHLPIQENEIKALVSGGVIGPMMTPASLSPRTSQERNSPRIQMPPPRAPPSQKPENKRRDRRVISEIRSAVTTFDPWDSGTLHDSLRFPTHSIRRPFRHRSRRLPSSAASERPPQDHHGRIQY